MENPFEFGEAVDGYPVRVVNERTVRAAAGLLFFPAVVSFMNALLTANYQPTRLFVIVFLIDMTLRMLNPRWAPSMIVGGWIVRKQTPDWVGAPQKRFAWGLGLLLGAAMLYLMVLNRFMGPVNMLVCASCLTLMFFETAFGICLGCKLYNVFNREKAQLCPGGVRPKWSIAMYSVVVKQSCVSMPSRSCTPSMPASARLGESPPSHSTNKRHESSVPLFSCKCRKSRSVRIALI